MNIRALFLVLLFAFSSITSSICSGNGQKSLHRAMQDDYDDAYFIPPLNPTQDNNNYTVSTTTEVPADTRTHTNEDFYKTPSYDTSSKYVISKERKRQLLIGMALLMAASALSGGSWYIWKKKWKTSKPDNTLNNQNVKPGTVVKK